MKNTCKTCKSRAYCYILNFQIFQYLGFKLNIDECPLYTRADECARLKDDRQSDSKYTDKEDESEQEKEFELNMEITVQCKMKEFHLGEIKQKSCSQLKRLSILIDRESLQQELRSIINREIKRKLGNQGKDSIMREEAKTNIDVPLIFSNWILN